jgi:hypothetical protein
MGALVQQTGGKIVDPAKIGTLLDDGHSLEQLLTLLALISFLVGVAVRILPGRLLHRPAVGSKNSSILASRDREPSMDNR